MGNQKLKWTADEEDALQRGVLKHGAGKWKNILKDPEFAPSLVNRSNIDLKDKWRNLNVVTGQSSKEKSRTPKPKPTLPALPAPPTVPGNATPVPPLPPPPVATLQTVTPSPQAQTTNDEDSKVPSRYNPMIFEALSTIKDANGSDINAIVNFIEKKHTAPQNQSFRRALGSRLRRLVSQGKLEKVQNCYRIKQETPMEMKSPDPKSPDPKSPDRKLPDPKSPTPKSPPPKEIEQTPPGSPDLLTYEEAMEDACRTAAYSVADAENKAYLSAEAVKYVERIAKMAEENDAMLKIAEELYEKCLNGEKFYLD